MSKTATRNPKHPKSGRKSNFTQAALLLVIGSASGLWYYFNSRVPPKSVLTFYAQSDKVKDAPWKDPVIEAGRRKQRIESVAHLREIYLPWAKRHKTIVR